MVFNKPWCNDVNLCTIVQESHTAIHINPYPGYVLNPVPSVKGIGIQEGSLCLAFYALDVPCLGTFGMVMFAGGSWAPFFGAIPSFQFKCKSVLDASPADNLR